ncbi:hypothetical protein S-CBP2_0010 [Synechococcus phage S-CBP2]|uniref:Uncharacterized protein n=1 Tax=Synechococcus phage S-CBP2 TaxID=756277 RepID=A0A096VKY6_9CAUD|nr:hypothetical protein S-CBP2_0010 [Synechococcus phage S-CBP2]AGF91119.1 hypothetical protein SXHG_00097 [Synechococcus phage MRHenn-2013a]AGK86716.1 hypothetical protein S-CBP2_0010 [Synechococcus phage S-CBP2]
MTNPLSLPLAVASFGLGVLIAAPARSATLVESQVSGVVAGEALCVLARHEAPKEVLREEFARLTKKFIEKDVLDLKLYGPAYLEVIDGLMQSCPERGLPEA